MLDFDRFIRACKQWPAGGPVREWGELLPTYLFEIDDETLIYDVFPIGTGPSGRSRGLRELARQLELHAPRAFAVVLPVELDEPPRSSGGRAEGITGPLATYREAVLVHAWSVDREEFILGTFDDPSEITWKDISEDGHARGGALGGPLDDLAAIWRARSLAA